MKQAVYLVWRRIRVETASDQLRQFLIEDKKTLLTEEQIEMLKNSFCEIEISVRLSDCRDTEWVEGRSKSDK